MQYILYFFFGSTEKYAGRKRRAVPNQSWGWQTRARSQNGSEEEWRESYDQTSGPTGGGPSFFSTRVALDWTGDLRKAGGGGGAVKQEMAASLSQLNDGIVRGMAIGAVFTDYAGKINCLDFHRKEDLLVTSSEDDSIRLYNITSATLSKTTYHRNHGADRVCFTHHPSSILCSSRYNLESAESLRYLSLYDNRCLRYFKGHKDRIVSLCMSPVNDSFMSGSLDHSVRIWDLRVNACQGILRLRGRPSVAYDQQGLVFAVAMEGGAIKLFDSRSYDKGPFDTFLVGGDTAEVSDIKFSNDGKSVLLTTTNNHIYVLDAYGGDKKCGFSLEPSPNITTEAAFTPDGQYVISGSGDGTLHAWNINTINEVARWNSHIGPITALKWAPRRAMFATASTALTFWIPNESNSN